VSKNLKIVTTATKVKDVNDCDRRVTIRHKLLKTVTDCDRSGKQLFFLVLTATSMN